MKLKITYPSVEKRKVQRKKILRILRLPFLAAAVVCPILNLITGGKAWSLVVLMSLYIAWTLLVSPDLVEYNRISQTVKATVNAGILLTLIDVFLASGWAIEVVPIVCFGGLIISGVLFFTNLERQKQNMLPMLLMIFITQLGAAIGLSVYHEQKRWALIVMGLISVVLLFACIIALGGDFIRELKKRVHVK